MNPYLCVYGHICLDQIISLEQLPQINTSINIAEVKRYFGGTGANLAAIASSLGVPTSLCSYVGDNFPIEFRKFLQSKGVDLSEVEVMEDYDTPTVIVVSDRDQNQIAYVYQGPMAEMGKFPIKTSAAEKAEYVHIGTGSPEYYLRVMHMLDNKNIALDPAQEIHHIWNSDRFKEALPYATSLFCNEGELQKALAYTDCRTTEDLLDYVSMIINTKGADGTYVYTEDGILHMPVLKTNVVDPTGAGDSFRGGYYAGRYRKKSLTESVACGNATAHFILQSNGATSNIPSWEEVEEKADDILASLKC